MLSQTEITHLINNASDEFLLNKYNMNTDYFSDRKNNFSLMYSVIEMYEKRRDKINKFKTLDIKKKDLQVQSFGKQGSGVYAVYAYPISNYHLIKIYPRSAGTKKDALDVAYKIIKSIQSMDDIEYDRFARMGKKDFWFTTGKYAEYDTILIGPYKYEIAYQGNNKDSFENITY